MLKRILAAWLVANFLIAGIVSWSGGGWYLGWGPVPAMLAEIATIILPNLIFPILLLRYAWPEPVESLRRALGWQWKGWKPILVGGAAFAVMLGVEKILSTTLGEGIPYNLPDAGGPVETQNPLLLLGLLLALLAFTILTVAAEETMFRGLIQTQVGAKYGPLAGLMLGTLLFGLRHLPADLFYAQVWQATPQMWAARQSSLYIFALLLGMARYFGRSTYASATTHMLMFALIFT